MNDNLHAVHSFLDSHATAVVASIDQDGQPHTATIYYVFADKRLFFVTKQQTIKAKNFNHNKKAALTVTDKDQPIAVDLVGVVDEINDIKIHDAVMQQVISHSYSELQDYAPIIKLHKGSFVVYEFKIEEAKLTDYTHPMGSVSEQKSS
jgi:general stress protein 26